MDTPIRTPNSIVWGRTKAKDLISSITFYWDKDHNEIFEDFLYRNDLSYLHVDKAPLLRQLRLDGFEQIFNMQGENVHAMIMTKVGLKLKNTAKRIKKMRRKETPSGRRL